ncbi:MAG: preprotein translocase subunit SecY [Candidatus Aenigmatarchaeota archaeon]
MVEEEEKAGEEKKGLEKKMARFLPSVKKPTYQLTFNTKLKWTGFALFMYLVLSYVTIYGIEKASYEQFRFYEIVLGSKFGSLMTLGIGPIVTGGIVMQLLVGSKILKWDTKKEEGRRKFQTWNKFLCLLFCFLEAIGLVMGGTLPIVGDFTTVILVTIQLAAGGVIALLLDDLVSKWGFGSGISLFIAAGVANQIFIRVFSPLPVACIPGNLGSCLPSAEQAPSGLIWQTFINLFSGGMIESLTFALPMITTLVIFLLVTYIQGIGIEIPLSFSAVRGFGRTWFLKLLYTSNIPVILAASLIANLQLFAGIGVQPVSAEISCSMLACYDKENKIVGGIAYYLTAPSNLLAHAIQGTLTTNEIIRAFTYLIFLSVVAMVFSVFWVSTSGMDAASVAEQLESMGMQIPGYRSDKRSMEAVLNRYIPHLAVLGGLLVGSLAAIADFLGAIGSGTGILLTVMIIYNYYEQLSSQNLEGAHPIVKKILGE